MKRQHYSKGLIDLWWFQQMFEYEGILVNVASPIENLCCVRLLVANPLSPAVTAIRCALGVPELTKFPTGKRVTLDDAPIMRLSNGGKTFTFGGECAFDMFKTAAKAFENQMCGSLQFTPWRQS